MKFVMHYRAPFTKQLVLLDAVRAGAAVHGDIVEGIQGFPAVNLEADGLILFGIGGMSADIYAAYKMFNRQTVFFDKGYTRGAYLRVAVNCFQPLRYMSESPRPLDRLEKLKVDFRPYKLDGGYILFDGASNKFCMWNNLGHWLKWGQDTVAQIAGFTDVPIIYRPRPSHNNDQVFPETKAQLSLDKSLEEDFARTRICVSYGGNIGWDCALAGIPHFAIGESIARPVSETDWRRIAEPRIPTEGTRIQWAADVAYCQWNLQEIASGEAWLNIRSLLK